MVSEISDILVEKGVLGLGFIAAVYLFFQLRKESRMRIEDLKMLFETLETNNRNLEKMIEMMKGLRDDVRQRGRRRDDD